MTVAASRSSFFTARSPQFAVRSSLFAIVSALLLWTGAPRAFAQPDVTRMSGVPLPVGDLAPGTVTVRVLRGSLASPITGQSVELIGPGVQQNATTSEVGRAEFSGLRPGVRVRARTTVAGAVLESQEFDIPAAGGIRVMLVAPASTAADPGGPAPQAAAQPGSVSLGEQSRFVFELGDDGLSVFYIFQIVNRGTAAVQPSSPIVFELPADARGATVLQGSSPQAAVKGRRLEVSGPFPPGPTLVQVGYTMPYSRPNLTIAQRLPVPLAEVMVIAQKAGAMTVHSRQLAQHREMPADDQTYIVGRGPRIDAGETITIDFNGLPYHATWPRALALALAVAILAAGAWTSMRRGGAAVPETSRRKTLERRRDRLFTDLTALEVQQRERALDPERYAERRRELVNALERVYAELDDDGVGMSRAS